MRYDTKTLTKEFIKAFECKDLKQVECLLADDVVFEDVPMGAHLGKENAVMKVADFFSKTQSIRWEVCRLIFQDNIAFVERINHVILGGKNIVLPMVMILEFNDNGLVKLFRDYFDLKTLEKQLS